MRSTRAVTRDILFSDGTAEGVLVLVTLDVEDRTLAFKVHGARRETTVKMPLPTLWEHAQRLRAGAFNLTDVSGPAAEPVPQQVDRPGLRGKLRSWLRREGWM